MFNPPSPRNIGIRFQISRVLVQLIVHYRHISKNVFETPPDFFSVFTPGHTKQIRFSVSNRFTIYLSPMLVVRILNNFFLEGSLLALC